MPIRCGRVPTAARIGRWRAGVRRLRGREQGDYAPAIEDPAVLSRGVVCLVFAQPGECGGFLGRGESRRVVRRSPESLIPGSFTKHGIRHCPRRVGSRLAASSSRGETLFGKNYGIGFCARACDARYSAHHSRVSLLHRLGASIFRTRAVSRWSSGLSPLNSF
jgi:hypothetical protein